ncbi:MAG: hypothetical protein K9I69_02900, partial [Ignavibacteriales bacterium]|nr:hypothetical protein [Ignavibacteriales bacterium]
MKKFFTFALLFVLSVTILNAQNKNTGKAVPQKHVTDKGLIVKTNNDIDPKGTARELNGTTEAMWDLLVNFDAQTPSGLVSHAGSETDGQYYYTAIWASANLNKYDMSGNFIETFTIPGVTGIRDMAYDGTYFYGGAASTKIYVMDFDNKTLVSTITTTASVRAIAYDSDSDAFWVNNWSDDIKLVNRSGAIIASFPVPSATFSQYGMAYDNQTDGGPYIWAFTGTTSDLGCQIEQISLANNQLTGVMHSVSGDLGAQYIAGGLWFSTDVVPGVAVVGGCAQGEPNHVFGYEIQVLQTFSNDVGVKAAVTPVSGYDLGMEDVKVVVKNYGDNSVSGFPVSYTLNGGTPVVENFTGTLASGAEADYTFQTKADLTGYGAYDFVASTNLTGDPNAANNSKSWSVVNDPTPSQVTAYPQSVAYWTGTTDGVSFTQQSAVNAVNMEHGWMSFDVSALPAGAQVNWVEFHGYVNAANWPYWSATPLSADPLTSDPATVYNEIDGNALQATAYLYQNESSTFTTGWKTYMLGNGIEDDIATAASTDQKFDMGIATRDQSVTYYIKFDGWNETNVPYLVIDYNAPLDNDAAAIQIMLPAMVQPGQIVPKAIVQNMSGAALSFNATLTISDGYSATMPVSNLGAGQQTEVTFDTWNAQLGGWTAELCVDAAGDPVPGNNCISKNVGVANITT